MAVIVAQSRKRGEVCEVHEPTGTFALYMPREGFAVSRVRGHFSAAMAREWVDTIEPYFTAGERFDTLHDWEAMSSYDTGTRQLLTKWVVQRRGLVRSARFLTGSSVVSLGIATAGIAAGLAGIELRVCGRREFDEALALVLGAPVRHDSGTVSVRSERAER
jgi:hypothetical protein